MRPLGVILILTACSIDNPQFGVSTDATTGQTGGSVTGDQGSTSRDPTSTSTSTADLTATVSSDVSVGTDPSTTTASTTGSSSGDPVAVETTGIVETSTGDPVCDLPPKNTTLKLDVILNDALYPKDKCLGMYGIGKGLLFMDGDSIQLKTTNECNVGVVGDQIVLGSGFAIGPIMQAQICVDVSIQWDPGSPNCKLGVLTIRKAAEPKTILYLGAFTLDPLKEFQMHTNSDNVTFCGCENGPGCCVDPDAGALTLTPDGGAPVAQGMSGFASNGFQDFTFYNLQSWMGPECVENGGRHIDWIARAF